MKQLRLLSLVLPSTLSIACASPTDSGPASLEGTWIAPVEAASPSGWYRRSITFEPNGSFTSDFRSYGIYPGQPRDELSGYSRTEGTYRVEGDQLVFQPARLVSWDRFYGVASPEQIREPYPYGTFFDDARYEVQGLRLTLRYTTYPADAPELAELVFIRFGE